MYNSNSSSGSHGMNARSTGAVSPGNSLGMQVLRPYWIRNSGGKGLQSVFLKAFSRWFWCALKFESHNPSCCIFFSMLELFFFNWKKCNTSRRSGRKIKTMPDGHYKRLMTPLKHQPISSSTKPKTYFKCSKREEISYT